MHGPELDRKVHSTLKESERHSAFKSFRGLSRSPFTPLARLERVSYPQAEDGKATAKPDEES